MDAPQNVFVAYLDILGFKSLMQKNSLETIKELLSTASISINTAKVLASNPGKEREELFKIIKNKFGNESYTPDLEK